MELDQPCHQFIKDHLDGTPCYVVYTLSDYKDITVNLNYKACHKERMNIYLPLRYRDAEVLILR